MPFCGVAATPVGFAQDVNNDTAAIATAQCLVMMFYGRSSALIARRSSIAR